MKLYLLILIIGAIVGGYIATIFFPKIVEKTQYKDKIVTVTKEIRAKDGSIIKEITKTEDKQGTKITPIMPRQNLLGASMTQKNVYEVTYGRKLFPNLFLTVGVDTDKNIKAGILYEF